MEHIKALLFVVFFIAGFGSADCLGQKAANRSSDKNSPDWSHLFPEVSGCVRIVGAIMKSNGALKQTAVYERAGFETQKSNPNYFGCGSITFRVQKGIKKPDSSDLYECFPCAVIKVRNYDALRVSPLCGNDESRGSISVFLDDDTIVSVHAYQGAEELFHFVENADYALIMRTIKNDK